MLGEERTVCYDAQLQVEAYQFKGIMQKFPNHFHEYYVIGFIEEGKRHLSCKNQEYQVEPGDLLLFNPRDNHTCEQIGQGTLDYRCLNIQPDVMEKVVYEIMGLSYKPYFASCVVVHSKQVTLLKVLHQMIMGTQEALMKEEYFYFLMEQLLSQFAMREEEKKLEVAEPIENACCYIQTHFKEQMTLQTLCEQSGLKKYTLLRRFTAQCGMTPFQYLETVRVGYAKQLLEQGFTITEAACEAGFSDQSHFTRFFKNYIGLTPKQYQNIFKGIR